MKLGVVGLGKLGLPLLAVLSEEYNAVGIDKDKSRVDDINNGKELFEPNLNALIEKNRDNIEVSTDFTEISDCDIVFILVNTYSDSPMIDLDIVKDALESVHTVNNDCLVAISSTVPVRGINELSKIHSNICYNPEFVAQGSVIKGFKQPKYVLIGTDDVDVEPLKDVWHSIHMSPIEVVSTKKAEIIKIMSNVYFSLGITFANTVGEVCDAYDVDPDGVMESIYRDRRDYKPGLGYGGPCFPKDIDHFIEMSMMDNIVSGIDMGVSINRCNERVKERYIEKINSSKHPNIGIIGVGYAKDLPYTWNSQPIQIINEIEDKEIYILDNMAQENAEPMINQDVTFCNSFEELKDNIDLIFFGADYIENYDVPDNIDIINPWTKKKESTDNTEEMFSRLEELGYF